MFETVTNSLEIVKRSFSVLMEEKKLLIFPIISGVVLLAIIASFLVPAVFLNGNQSSIGSTAFVLLLALFYFVSYLVVIFFNSALAYATNNKMEGKPVSISESIGFAFSKIPNILAWSIIAATVGLILSILRDKAESRGGIGGLIGGLVIGFIGMAWSLATFFVVPIMVLEGQGPFSAIRRSIELIKQKWGESVIGGTGISLIFLVLYLLGLAPLVIAFFIGVSDTVLLMMLVPIVVYWIVLFIVQSTLEGIFVVALYRYATTGQQNVYENEHLEGAFRHR